MKQKIIISLLICSLIVGISLDQSMIIHQTAPIESPISLDKEKPIISKPEENKDEENEEQPKEEFEHLNKSEEKSLENDQLSSEDKKHPIQKPIENNSSLPTNPEQSTPEENKPLTQEQKNDKTRKELEQKYGIVIRYGNEMGDYRPKMLVPIKMTDHDEIAKYLKEVESTLKYYPIGFFKEMKNKGMPLTLYLIKSVPNDVFAGLTDKEFYDNIKITVTTRGIFNRVLNHEIMHYIDAYLQIIMYPKEPFQAYQALNPTGYHYGSFTIEYNYHMINRPKGAYFVNNYGQTNVLEDRATIFEDVMSRAYAPIGCYEKGERIRLKAEVIASQIETYFQTVSTEVTEHWERFLKD